MVGKKEKKRDKISRQRAKFIVIGAEGNNKTEKNYFNDYFKSNKQYKVKFPTSKDTDPEGVIDDTINYINKENIDMSNGDIVWCFIDSDTDISKQSQIDNAFKIAKANGIELLISNPCFEVWFLQHYSYSTKPFPSSSSVINELKKYIPNYEKNTSVYPIISEKILTALDNAKKLEKHHDNLGVKKKHISRNPSTEVFKVLKPFIQ